MAGNAIAWKEEFSEAGPLRRGGWLAEAKHLLTALRLLIVADRMEGHEQTRVVSGRR